MWLPFFCPPSSVPGAASCLQQGCWGSFGFYHPGALTRLQVTVLSGKRYDFTNRSRVPLSLDCRPQGGAGPSSGVCPEPGDHVLVSAGTEGKCVLTLRAVHFPKNLGVRCVFRPWISRNWRQFDVGMKRFLDVSTLLRVTCHHPQVYELGLRGSEG